MRHFSQSARAFLSAAVIFVCGCYGVDATAPGTGADVLEQVPDAGADGGPDAGLQDAGDPGDSSSVEDAPPRDDAGAGAEDGGNADSGPDPTDSGLADAGAESETDGGEDVGTDAGTDVEDAGSDAGTDAGCKPPIVFERPDQFIPTVAEPALHVEIPMEDGLVFGKVELEIDFVRGPWSTVPPGPDGGMSNVFWLHRGMKGNHWLGNLVGYMNFKSRSTLELSANLGITDPQVWKQAISKRVPTVEGESYHAQFAYDVSGGSLWYRAFHAGAEVAYAETTPLVSEIVGWDIFKGGAPGFFVELGFASGGGATVEIPTYDWVYSNLVVRFHFLEGGC